MLVKMSDKETRAQFVKRMNDYIEKRKFVKKHGKILLKEIYAGSMDVLFNDGHFIHIGRVWSDNSLRVEYSKNYTQSTVKRLVKAKTFDILRFVNVIKINKT